MQLVLDLHKPPSSIFSRKLTRLKHLQFVQLDLKKVEYTDKIELKNYFLNQSYIFHLIAFWQVFIEDLLIHSIYLLRKNDFDNVMCDLLENSFKVKLKKFNTASCENIDQLFHDTLGIEKISNSWVIQDNSKNFPKDLLKQLLKARHEIAHTGTTDLLLEFDFDQNFKKMEVLFKMAELMEYELTQYIIKLKESKQN